MNASELYEREVRDLYSGEVKTIQVAGAILNQKKTLTERVQALENDMQSVKKSIAALEGKVGAGK